MVGEDEKAKNKDSSGPLCVGPAERQDLPGRQPALPASCQRRWPAHVRQKRERGLGAPARPLPTDRERQV